MDTTRIGKIVSKELGVLEIRKGIEKAQILQLIKYARLDKEIVKFTSDTQRFADYATFLNWQEKGRTIYTLSDSVKNLLGISWFGQESLPEGAWSKVFEHGKYRFTFAIRTYPPARGKGLSQQFLRTTLQDYNIEQDNQEFGSGFWLETSIDNLPAKRLYQNLGFRQVSAPNNKGKIIMIFP